MRSVGRELKKNHLWFQAPSLRYALESLNGAKQLNQWIASFFTHSFNCNMSMSKKYHFNKLLYLFNQSSLTATHAPIRKNNNETGKEIGPVNNTLTRLMILFYLYSKCDPLNTFLYIYMYNNSTKFNHYCVMIATAQWHTYSDVTDMKFQRMIYRNY